MWNRNKRRTVAVKLAEDLLNALCTKSNERTALCDVHTVNARIYDDRSLDQAARSSCFRNGLPKRIIKHIVHSGTSSAILGKRYLKSFKIVSSDTLTELTDITSDGSAVVELEIRDPVYRYSA